MKAKTKATQERDSHKLKQVGFEKGMLGIFASTEQANIKKGKGHKK